MKSECRYCGKETICECGQLGEQQRFLRSAAIALATAVGRDGEPALTPIRCWERAQALWMLKPEGA